MQVAKEKLVSIDYTLTDEQGNVLDTSEGREPLSYVHGTGQIIPGLEHALEGTSPGETVHVTVEPRDAYGERDPNLVHSVPRDEFPDDCLPQVGQHLQIQTPTGTRVVTVANVDDDAVMIDANHPLAGRSLNFDVTVNDVQNPTAKPR